MRPCSISRAASAMHSTCHGSAKSGSPSRLRRVPLSALKIALPEIGEDAVAARGGLGPEIRGAVGDGVERLGDLPALGAGIGQEMIAAKSVDGPGPPAQIARQARMADGRRIGRDMH